MNIKINTAGKVEYQPISRKIIGDFVRINPNGFMTKDQIDRYNKIPIGFDKKAVFSKIKNVFGTKFGTFINSNFLKIEKIKDGSTYGTIPDNMCVVLTLNLIRGLFDNQFIATNQAAYIHLSNISKVLELFISCVYGEANTIGINFFITMFMGDQPLSKDAKQKICEDSFSEDIPTIVVIELMKKYFSFFQETMKFKRGRVLSNEFKSAVTVEMVNKMKSHQMKKNEDMLKTNKKARILIGDYPQASKLLEKLYQNFELFYKEWLSMGQYDRFIAGKALLSLMYINRSISFSKKESEIPVSSIHELLSSIVCEGRSPFSVDQIHQILPELKTVLNEIKISFAKLKIDVWPGSDFETDVECQLSSNAGPNNGNALLGIPQDAIAVQNDIELKVNLERLADKLKVKNFIDKIDVFAKVGSGASDDDGETTNENSKKRVICHSKLNFVKELGGKIRVVASCDWFTQSLLKFIEDRISLFIKGSKIGLESFYDQEGAFKKINASISKSRQAATTDMKSSTDNIPRVLQEIILNELSETLFDVPNIGTDWVKVIADRKFYVKETNSYVSYGIGQGMGAKSSFIMLQFSNYIMCRIAQIRASKRDVSVNHDFQIVGDDCGFSSDSINLEYQNILVSLQIPVSIDKCTSSKSDSDTDIVFEFLKIYRYGEYTFRPLSVRVLKGFWNKPDLYLFGVIKTLIHSGLPFNMLDLINYTIHHVDKRKAKLGKDSNLKYENPEELIKNVIIFCVAPIEIGGLAISAEELTSFLPAECVEDALYLLTDIELKEYQLLSYNLAKYARTKDRIDNQIKTQISTFLEIGTLRNLWEYVSGQDSAILNEQQILENWVKLQPTTDKWINYDPKFNIIIAACIKQRSAFNKCRISQELNINTLRDKVRSYDATPDDIDVVIRSRKALEATVRFSVEQILTEQVNSDDVEVRGINNQAIDVILNSQITKTDAREFQAAKRSIFGSFLD